MPIVFVHGVNTRREGRGYATNIKLTERFFESHFSGVTVNGRVLASVKPSFPYWGDLATKFAWDMASLPSDEVDALGGAVDQDWRPVIAALEDALGTLAGTEENPLLTLAKRSFLGAVETTSDLLVLTAPEAGANEAAHFASEVQALAQEDPNPTWVAVLNTDAQFVSELLSRVSKRQAVGPQALGNPFPKIGQWLGEGAAKLKQGVKSVVNRAVDGVGDFASTKLLAWTRPSLNGTLGRFFGDVFVYFDKRGDRGTPGEIPQRILSGIAEAMQTAPGNDPLIVVGHSLGGVICHDLFSHFRPDLEVDLFVTVGSQVSHFEEMKRFKASDGNIKGPNGRAPRAANVKHWINVFDRVDIFSYSCKRVFADVEDFEYDTKTYVGKAHGAYFDQKRFYQRLRARVDALPTL
jgi:hypothetical protein